MSLRMFIGQNRGKIWSEEPFVMKVKTDNTGTSTDTQFTIPTIGSGYNYKVERCDAAGVALETFKNVSGNKILEWDALGTYIVKIYPNSAGRGFPRIYFNDMGDKAKLLDVEQVGNCRWQSMENAFYGCSNMEWSATDTANTKDVTSCLYTFRGCNSFNGDISGWDTSNVENMREMFRDASSFNQDIGGWDVAVVTNMAGMFHGASVFNQDISNWNTGNVIHFVLTHWTGGMFQSCPFNNGEAAGESTKPLTWDVSKCTHFAQMFRGNTAFNQDISGWDVSSGIYMAGMFRGATSFNQDIGGWNTKNVKEFGAYFGIGEGGILQEATSFAQDISGWDFANCNDAQRFILGHELTTVNYDALLIALADRPDYAISKFEEDGSNTKVTAAGHSLVAGNTVTISGTTNYDGIHEVLEVDGNTFVIDTAYVADDATGTVLKDLKADVSFHAGSSHYSADTARQKIIDDYNWTITDGGQAT